MNFRSPIIAIACAVSLLAATGCAVMRDQESVGAYIDDTAISTAVKPRFFDNKEVDAGAIRVETSRGKGQKKRTSSEAAPRRCASFGVACFAATAAIARHRIVQIVGPEFTPNRYQFHRLTSNQSCRQGAGAADPGQGRARQEVTVRRRSGLRHPWRVARAARCAARAALTGDD